MKKLWKRAVCLVCAISLLSAVGCDKDEGGDIASPTEGISAESSVEDSSSTENVVEITPNFGALQESPKNMQMQVNAEIRYQEGEKDLKVYITGVGKIDGENGYAHAVVFAKNKGLVIAGIEYEGYYVGGVVYDPMLRQREEVAWGTWLLRKTGISEEGKLPLRLLSEKIADREYVVLPNGALQTEVSAVILSYVFNTLLQRNDFYEISRVYFSTIDCKILLTDTGHIRTIILSSEYVNASSNTLCIVSAEISLSEVGSTTVKAPLDGAGYEEVTGM